MNWRPIPREAQHSFPTSRSDQKYRHRQFYIPLGAQVQEGDGFSSGEDGARLEIATVLVDQPDLVIIAGGIASLPKEDALALLDVLIGNGAVVIVLEPGAPVSENANVIALEPPKEAGR